MLPILSVEKGDTGPNEWTQDLANPGLVGLDLDLDLVEKRKPSFCHGRLSPSTHSHLFNIPANSLTDFLRTMRVLGCTQKIDNAAFVVEGMLTDVRRLDGSLL